MSIASFTFYAMIAGWFGFAAAMFVAVRRGRQVERRRESRAVAGIVLQMLAYSAVWSVRRHWTSPLLAQTVVPEALLCVIALALIAGSVWLVLAAVRTLGRHWSVAARVIEGHELVMTGPYALVRNPIYSGMLGMLVATGIAVTAWWWLPFGVACFAAGTAIRVRAEERLLRGQFGAAYDAYAARVPALIPFLPSRRSR
jgi:protein-S-isoprenylcysteine O-methyltransferase Ste14